MATKEILAGSEHQTSLATTDSGFTAESMAVDMLLIEPRYFCCFEKTIHAKKFEFGVKHYSNCLRKDSNVLSCFKESLVEFVAAKGSKKMEQFIVRSEALFRPMAKI